MSKSIFTTPSNTKNNFLLVGCVAGLGYALGTWGIEAIVLTGAHGMYPFLKFAFGAIACILAGLLAGWLSKHTMNVLINFIIWAATGAALNRIANYFNFPGMQALLLWLQPKIGSLTDYSIDYGVSTRGTLMLVIGIVTCGLIGLFCNSIVEEINSNAGFRRSSALMIWIIAFLGVGYLGASLNTNPIRDSIVKVDKSIQFYNEYAGEDLSTDVKLEQGLFGMKDIEPYTNRPYKLVAASYDKMLVFVNVLVLFEGQMARCPVINGNLGTCVLVE